jgi:hypothetical protein
MLFFVYLLVKGRQRRDKGRRRVALGTRKTNLD